MATAAEETETFLTAAAIGDEAAVRLGIALGHVNETGNIHPRGWSALHWAVWAEKGEIVNLLVAAGANINSDTAGHPNHCLRKGCTPLHWAVEKQNAAIAMTLLEAGADVDAANTDGQTPLCIAVDEQNLDLAKMLLERGASVNVKDIRGCTSLHLAAMEESTEILKLLIAAGASVHATDGQGQRPLHEAALVGNVESVKTLLLADADPRAQSGDGETPADLARFSRKEEVVVLLRGAEEEWNQSFLLQVSAQGAELTFRTMAGNLAAELSWASERSVQEMPMAVLEAIRRSGFEAPLKPLRASNLKFVLPNGAVLNTAPEAALLLEQLPPA